MTFHGVKVAVLVDDKLLVHLRDNKPGLFNANMWDFPGGGREGEESPEECAIREVQEEFGVTLRPEDIVWEKTYPAQKDPSQVAYFMVATLTMFDVGTVQLTEGQEWMLMEQDEFLERTDVVDALKGRFQDYLSSTQQS